jgi:hypothetical protein
MTENMDKSVGSILSHNKVMMEISRALVTSYMSNLWQALVRTC